MNEKLDKKMESFAPRLDKALQAPVDAFFNFLDRFFKYSYRETTDGVFGIFDTPEKMQHAARQTDAKGYTNFDCLTPFPIHGLEFDMGLGRSKIPYITFFAGLAGLALGFFLQYNTHELLIPPLWHYLDGFPNLRSYPLNIGGKPTYSWPAMVPVLFELVVLLGGHTTVAGLIMLGKMFRPFRKVLHPRITNDKFCLWIPTDSANYNESDVVAFIQGLGGKDITVVKDEEQSPATPVATG